MSLPNWITKYPRVAALLQQAGDELEGASTDESPDREEESEGVWLDEAVADVTHNDPYVQVETSTEAPYVWREPAGPIVWFNAPGPDVWQSGDQLGRVEPFDASSD